MNNLTDFIIEKLKINKEVKNGISLDSDTIIEFLENNYPKYFGRDKKYLLNKFDDNGKTNYSFRSNEKNWDLCKELSSNKIVKELTNLFKDYNLHIYAQYGRIYIEHDD